MSFCRRPRTHGIGASLTPTAEVANITLSSETPNLHRWGLDSRRLNWWKREVVSVDEYDFELETCGGGHGCGNATLVVAQRDVPANHAHP